MKRFALACGLIVSCMVDPAHASFSEAACCACLGDEKSVEQTIAFFCTSPTTEGEMDAAEERCDDLPNSSLRCLIRAQEIPAPTNECREELREVSILCPVSNGAPTLGHTGLAGLVSLLGVIGAVTARRRARRRG